MDGIAALGLASNILQLVKFSYSLFKEAAEIRSSLQGVSQRHLDLKTVAEQLDGAIDSVDESCTGASQFSDLTQQCRTIAGSLANIINDLQRRDPHTQWSSFIQAAKSVRKDGEIRVIAKRLDQLQSSLVLRLVASLGQKQGEISLRLDSIVSENRRLEVAQTADLEMFKQDIIQSLRDLRRDASLAGSTVHRHCSSISRLQPVGDQAIRQLTDRMNILSTQLANLSAQGIETTTVQKVLKSLFFDSMNDREENVVIAHESTLTWIFEGGGTSSVGRPRIHFLEWLREHDSIYWVQGKPGSGKSTMMKFLCRHPRTKALLEEWAHPKQLVVASFFFWSSGSRKQQSQVGLLQSLLFQILRQCPELTAVILPTHASHDDFHQWTHSQLQAAFSNLKAQQTISARFCFFIDGLDEFDGKTNEGSHSELVAALQSLADCHDIKLCLSSRPWNVFKDAFGNDCHRTIALQDVNRQDIQNYVQRTFAEDDHLIRLGKQDSRYTDLVLDIVERAQGVFLWVSLVVRALKDGLTNADRVIDLQQRLYVVPTDLEEYFAQILISIDAAYKKQACQTFRVALVSPEPLSAFLFSLMDEEDPQYAFGTLSPVSKEELAARHLVIERRLNGRCKGLLEIAYVKGWDDDDDLKLGRLPKVEFIHRTVRDFLQCKGLDFLERNVDYDASRPDHLASYCKALLAQVKRCPTDRTTARNTLGEIVLSARHLQENHLGLTVSILDEAKAAFLSHSSPGLRKTGCFQELLDLSKDHVLPQVFGYETFGVGLFFNLVIENGLHLYLDDKLRAEPTLTLDSAAELLHMASMQQKPAPLGVFKVLLAHGVDLNQKHGGLLPWARRVALDSKRYEVDDNSLEICKLLIRNGADLDARATLGDRSQKKVSEILFLGTGLTTRRKLEILEIVRTRQPKGPKYSLRMMRTRARIRTYGRWIDKTKHRDPLSERSSRAIESHARS